MWVRGWPGVEGAARVSRSMRGAKRAAAERALAPRAQKYLISRAGGVAVQSQCSGCGRRADSCVRSICSTVIWVHGGQQGDGAAAKLWRDAWVRRLGSMSWVTGGGGGM